MNLIYLLLYTLWSDYLPSHLGSSCTFSDSERPLKLNLGRVLELENYSLEGSYVLVIGPLMCSWLEFNRMKTIGKEKISLEDWLFCAGFPVWKIKRLVSNCLCAKVFGSDANKSTGQCVCLKQNTSNYVFSKSLLSEPWSCELFAF